MTSDNTNVKYCNLQTVTVAGDEKMTVFSHRSPHVRATDTDSDRRNDAVVSEKTLTWKTKYVRIVDNISLLGNVKNQM